MARHFEDLGNGQTRLTFLGNEPMESAKDSGQVEAGTRPWRSSEVVAELRQAE
jgi:hypothetical protein